MSYNYAASQSSLLEHRPWKLYSLTGEPLIRILYDLSDLEATLQSDIRLAPLLKQEVSVKLYDTRSSQPAILQKRLITIDIQIMVYKDNKSNLLSLPMSLPVGLQPLYSTSHPLLPLNTFMIKHTPPFILQSLGDLQLRWSSPLEVLVVERWVGFSCLIDLVAWNLSLCVFVVVFVYVPPPITS